MKTEFNCSQHPNNLHFQIKKKARPFVKWVGGKRGVIKDLLLHLPVNINNYYEPFVGGGALFFEIANKVNYSYISDLNPDLMIAYNVIKTNPHNLINLLKIHKENHSKEYYYKIRDLQELSCPIENTARFIYLLTTCFNGLFRVNSENYFNTPIGRYKNPNILDQANINAVNLILQNTDVKYQDFSRIIPNIGDFVYFDPPYYPIKDTSFTKYIFNGFAEYEQIRLRDFILTLIKKGVNIMVSNSNTEFIRNLYSNKDFFTIEKILSPRVISCKSNNRIPIFELLITNNYVKKGYNFRKKC